MAESTRVRRWIVPLIVDAVAVLAGGYAINKLTGDRPSPWWWALAGCSVLALVASGLWKLWIEKQHSQSQPSDRAVTAGNQVSADNSNNVTASADTGDTSVSSGGVSVSAKNNSFVAWNVNGTVNFGGSQQQAAPQRPAGSDEES